MMYFLDFDRTLFDSDAFLKSLEQRPEVGALVFEDSEDRSRYLYDLIQTNVLKLAEENVKSFLFGDVPEMLRHLGNEGCILTHGVSEYQKIKVEKATAGIPRVSALYTSFIRKGEFMKDRIHAYGPQVIFVDDDPIELENMNTHCPHVRCFEIRRDGLAGDGRWQVITTLSELP